MDTTTTMETAMTRSRARTLGVIGILMAFAMAAALALAPAHAYAATKTVKNADFETKVSTVNKKATTVKKGTTTLKFKKHQGWVKFKATKSKTYSFTISNAKSSKGFTSNGYASVYVKDPYFPKSLTRQNVSTKGGKDATLWYSVNGAKFTYKDVLSRPIAKRTGKVKLKKNQEVFFYFYTGSGSKPTITFKVS